MSSKRMRTSPTGGTHKQAAKTDQSQLAGKKPRLYSETDFSPTGGTPGKTTRVSGIPISSAGSMIPIPITIKAGAFVEFIMLSSDGKAWPATKNNQFWESADTFISNRCGFPRLFM